MTIYVLTIEAIDYKEILGAFSDPFLAAARADEMWLATEEDWEEHDLAPDEWEPPKHYFQPQRTELSRYCDRHRYHWYTITATELIDTA